jgi:hypothetical protein
MSDINGTGMDAPANPTPAGAVTSREATRKNPKQGIRSGIKIDTNRHGIRRETSLDPKPPKKYGRKKV